MPDTIGITKELNNDEKLTHSSQPTELIFMREDVYERFRGWERLERVESMFRGIIYLTNQRVIFFKLFEVPGVSTGQKKNLLVGSAGTFTDIPLNKITSVMKRKVSLSKENIFRFTTVFGGDENQVNDGPGLEIAFNERKVHPKNAVVNLNDLLIILGSPIFTFESVLREQIKASV